MLLSISGIVVDSLTNMSKHFVKLLVIITSLSALLLNFTAVACECAPKESQLLFDDFESASYIFIETVTSITTTWRDGGTGASRDVLFYVNDLIKGPSVSTDRSTMI